MFALFKKKKQYLIKWERNCYTQHEQHETVVHARCEADALWKFLQGRNPIIEQLEILKVDLFEKEHEKVSDQVWASYIKSERARRNSKSKIYRTN